MSPPVERFEMRANFEGLIQLLAKNLYPEPDVFVRELIQNAHDSIRIRQEVEPALEGRIAVELHPSRSQIVFRDNGMGMDRHDIKEFLSVIGSTGTGSARERLQSADSATALRLIGQFGIGMLSAFVVADRVTVRTRKLGSGQAFIWENAGTTECELGSTDELCEVGSEIIVSVAETHSFMLDRDRLHDVIIKYCDFIPVPVTLNGDPDPVNAMQAPWDRAHWPSEAEKDAAYRVFLSHRYPDVPLDVIPVEIDEPFRARGTLYISDRRIPDFNTPGVVDVLVRRMFVRAADPEFLPPWAKFIRGIIDSPDLQPTAARDNVQRDDPAFAFLRQRLAELILERLTYLAKHEPKRFAEINRWHHYHLKGMAVLHDDFFGLIGESLLFQTNRGFKSLRDCVRNEARLTEAGAPVPVYYFAQREAAEQFYRLADARGWTIVNAGHLFEEELLEKYAEMNPSRVRLVPLHRSEDSGLFQPAPDEARDRYRRLELDTQVALRLAGIGNVSVHVRSFAPPTLPAVILDRPESQSELALSRLLRQPWFMESLEEITKEAIRQRNQRPLILFLNHQHPLVQRASELDTGNEDVRCVMVGLFLSAVLLSPNLLTDDKAEIAHGHLIGLLDRLTRDPFGTDPAQAASQEDATIPKQLLN